MTRTVTLCLSAALVFGAYGCSKKKDEAKMGKESQEAMEPPRRVAEPPKRPEPATLPAVIVKTFEAWRAKEREEIKIWEGIKTLDDFKKAFAGLVKQQLAIKELRLANLERIDKLNKGQLVAYNKHRYAMALKYRGQAVKLVKQRARVLKIKGAAEFHTVSLKKAMTPEVKAKEKKYYALFDKIMANIRLLRKGPGMGPSMAPGIGPKGMGPKEKGKKGK